MRHIPFLGILLALSMIRPAPSGAAGVNVEGRVVELPAPPGMKPWGRLHDGPKDVMLGRYAADSTVASWQKRGSPGSIPRFALASESPRANRDETTAAAEIDHRRATTLGTADGAAMRAWARALQSGREGRAGRIPYAPEGLLRIERIEDISGAFIELQHLREGQDKSAIASALVLVRGRVIALDVIQSNPTDCRELATLRAAIVEWVRSVQAANR